MALTLPPTIPDPSHGEANFNSEVAAYLAWWATNVAEMNQMATAYNLSLSSTSTSSLTVATGVQNLIVQTGLGLLPSMPVRIASQATPTTFMDCIVTAYTSGTGALAVTCLTISGTGTLASWRVFILPAGSSFATLGSNTFTGTNKFIDSLLNIVKNGSANFVRFIATAITASRDIALQDRSGTMMLLPFNGNITASRTLGATDKNTQQSIITNNNLDITMPAANTYAAGEFIQLNSFTIGNLLYRNGTDTFVTSYNAAATTVPLNPGTEIYAYSDGVSKWYIRIKAAELFDMTGYEAASTVTAGAFVVGRQYEIKVVGTTSFTAIGASANTVGVIFTATGVGSGTGTAVPSVQLNSKERCYYDLSATTSLALRLKTNSKETFTIEQYANFTLSASGLALLLPNNQTFAAGFNQRLITLNNNTLGGSSSTGAQNAWLLCMGGASQYELTAKFYTDTAGKRSIINAFGSNSTSSIGGTGGMEWQDTTTPWTSLGTVTSIDALTGRMYVQKD